MSTCNETKSVAEAEADCLLLKSKGGSCKVYFPSKETNIEKKDDNNHRNHEKRQDTSHESKHCCPNGDGSSKNIGSDSVTGWACLDYCLLPLIGEKDDNVDNHVTVKNCVGPKMTETKIFIPDEVSKLTKNVISSDERTFAEDQSVLSIEYVVRKSVNSLSTEEEERFVAAVKKLMENDSTGEPQTSEWFRIAGYHGWPSDYCSHGEETFPAWHRAYLLEMETALRNADRKLGNDGNIALPYWDWVNDPSFPNLIRKHFAELPKGFFKTDSNGSSISLANRNSDNLIELNIRRARLDRMVNDCLEVNEHWKHASTRWRRGMSLEQPHNVVHVAVGYPMTVVAYAAFDPIFWLHHCNVDRIHEYYLRKHSDSLEEFRAMQMRLAHESGEKDRFSNPLEPFLNPKTGNPFFPAEMFDVKELGYVYDEMGETKARGFSNLTGLARPTVIDAPKVYCLFRDVNPLKLEKKSYMLYVFIFNSHETASSWEPPAPTENIDRVIDQWTSASEFAGVGAVFGGKGMECTNCRTRKPYNIIVDISENIQARSIVASESVVCVVAVDEIGNIQPFEELPIPPPEIIGDIEERDKSDLSLGSKGGQSTSLQRSLMRKGFYKAELDGEFGPKTEQALKEFQSSLGLKNDGIAGPLTRNMLSRQWIDSVAVGTEGTETSWSEGSFLKIWLGESPGYLDRVAFVKEINAVFDEWSNECGAKFNIVGDLNDADFRLQFGEVNPDFLECEKADLGMLGKDFILFDESRKWKLSDGTETCDGIHFRPVFLHLLGHALGFGHVHDEASIMFPVYQPDKTSITSAWMGI